MLDNVQIRCDEGLDEMWPGEQNATTTIALGEPPPTIDVE